MDNYRELTVWQESYKLVIIIYKLTSAFPKEELYCLVSQIRRAVISISANIAEGFNRRTSKEYLQFLYIARGSLQEFDFLLLLSKDLKYISEKEYKELKSKTDLVGRLLSGLINSIKRK